ncbi:hypothetical protein B0E51_08300 [Rhodanobacter sp. C05]|nr:hypothetical protein B0E51_08300 [Rhodanobacter sp. C05]
MERSRGFTMLELMIVVAIIALLSAIALPIYTKYGYRARRPDGQNLLLSIANAEERYYATNNKYGLVTDIGYSTDPTPSEKGYYAADVVVAGTASATFVAAAVPVAGGDQAKDDCGTLNISNAGVKTSSGTTTNGTCW